MRRVILTVIATAIGLVLLLSFKTHSGTAASVPPAAVSTPAPSAVPSATPSAGAVPSQTNQPSASSPQTSAPATKTKAPSTTTAAKRTIDGEAVDTRYGAVQVRVTLSGKTITAIDILQVPDRERRDVEINTFAVPVLTQEALQAQSAKIDMVSGATYTSEGYLQSLQSALDKA